MIHGQAFSVPSLPDTVTIPGLGIESIWHAIVFLLAEETEYFFEEVHLSNPFSLL